VPEELLAFSVAGPFEVLCQYERGGRIVTADAGPELFERVDSLDDAKGCYVFGIRSGGGTLPWYVGKTASGFRWECFQPHKLNKYNEAIAKAGYGTPVLYFVVHPANRGRPNRPAIDELEGFLIQAAYIRNPELLNRTRVEGRGWAIQGFGNGRGRPPRSAIELARALGVG
jgi:hypothetical protein